MSGLCSVHQHKETGCKACEFELPDPEANGSPAPSCCGRFEAAKHSLQFQCDWAVYPKDGGSSLCYVTSHERADFFAKCLNRLDELGELESILHANAEEHKSHNPTDSDTQ